MKFAILGLCLASILLDSQTPTCTQEVVGIVRGTVTLRGEIPSQKKVDVSWCKADKLYPRGLRFDPVPVDGERRVRQCLVFVRKGLEGKTYPPPRSPVNIKFDKYQLLPRVAGVMVGQPLVVETLDEELHNAHSLPLKKDNKEFNTGLPSKGMKVEKLFGTAEVGIMLKCDVHPWEKMWIAVLGHPFYSVTDDKGQFEIKGLPPGKYTIEAWQENCREALREIEIAGPSTTTLDFEVEVGRRGVTVWELKADSTLGKSLVKKTLVVYGDLRKMPGYLAPTPPFEKGTVLVALEAGGKWAGFCGLKKGAEAEVQALPDGTSISLKGRFLGMMALDGASFAMEDCELVSASPK